MLTTPPPFYPACHGLGFIDWPGWFRPGSGD